MDNKFVTYSLLFSFHFLFIFFKYIFFSIFFFLYFLFDFFFLVTPDVDFLLVSVLWPDAVKSRAWIRLFFEEGIFCEFIRLSVCRPSAVA